MKRTEARAPLTILLLLLCSIALADDFASLRADRTVIESVYYRHRLGEKEPLEQVLLPAAVENLVRQDVRKEAALKKAYGVEVTPTMLDLEVQRMDTTTRAPEILTEIRRGLGNDAERFAHSMARPIIVERELRCRFDNDDKLHAAQRRRADEARETALTAAKDGVLKQIAAFSANQTGVVTETIWELTARPEARKAEISAPLPTLNSQSSTSSSGAYSVEATAQIAQVLNPPNGERNRKVYFEDLDPELQKVLRVQLQKPGDVSAVIETPSGFLLFLAKEKSAETLSVTSLSISKRSYEEWLAQQP